MVRSVREALLLDNAINPAPKVEETRASQPPKCSRSRKPIGLRRREASRSQKQSFELHEVLDWHSEHRCSENPAPFAACKGGTVKEDEGQQPGAGKQETE
jgi:hypothetical protein